MKVGFKYLFFVVLITLPILGIGAVLWSEEPPPLVLESPSPSPSNPEPTNSGQPEPSTAPQTDWIRGADDAIIIIDVFPEWDCAGCIETEAVVYEAMHFYSKVTAMVYHHYPLSEWGQLCCEALEAAGEQGKFWEFHDRLVEDPYMLNISRESAGLNTIAAELGLNMEAFVDALQNGKFKEKVEAEYKEAVARGVAHATVFINGMEYHKYPPQVSDISAIVVEELDKARGG